VYVYVTGYTFHVQYRLICNAVIFFVRYLDTVDFVKEPGIKIIISCAM
jgi:hypothetical protein